LAELATGDFPSRPAKKTMQSVRLLHFGDWQNDAGQNDESLHEELSVLGAGSFLTIQIPCWCIAQDYPGLPMPASSRDQRMVTKSL
jgi:hypothetical protein